MVRIKLHQYVDIASWTEVLPKDRAEKRQASDVMSPAKL